MFLHLSAELQREGLKELKKSKGKFKPAKVFKMLNQKAESNKDSVDKKTGFHSRTCMLDKSQCLHFLQRLHVCVPCG